MAHNVVRPFRQIWNAAGQTLLGALSAYDHLASACDVEQLAEVHATFVAQIYGQNDTMTEADEIHNSLVQTMAESISDDEEPNEYNRAASD